MNLKLVGEVEIRDDSGSLLRKTNRILNSGKVALYAVLSGSDPRNLVYLLRLGASEVPPSSDQTDLLQPYPEEFLVGSRDYDENGVRYTFSLVGLPDGFRFSEAALYASYYDPSSGQVKSPAIARAVFRPVSLNASYSYQLVWKFSLA